MPNTDINAALDRDGQINGTLSATESLNGSLSVDAPISGNVTMTRTYQGGWNALTGKPFSTLGDDFSVNDDELELSETVTEKIAVIDDLADVATSGSYNDLSNKPTLFSGNYNDLTNKPNLSTVATSGSYNDLTNKPSIPTKTSQLINDSGFLTEHQDISGKADKSNTYTKTEVNSLVDVVDSKVDYAYDNGFVTKNILKTNINSQTLNGVTVTNNGNGTYTLNGTDTGDGSWLWIPITYKANVNYRLVGVPNEASSLSDTKVGIKPTQEFAWDETHVDWGRGVNFSFSADTSGQIAIRIRNGKTFSNYVIKPMLVYADDFPNVTYNDYQPYAKSNVELTKMLPTPPTTSGNYTLKATVSSSGVVYSWVSV